MPLFSLSPGFVEDYLYAIEDAGVQGDGTSVFMGEPHMDGVFIKFNNNGGSVNKEDHRQYCGPSA